MGLTGQKAEPMILYGFGGHARVVAECLESAGRRVTAVFDDSLSAEACPFPFYGSYQAGVMDQEQILIAIGDNTIRKRLAGIVQHQAGRAVHFSAILSPTASIGEGSVILHRSLVQSQVVIGRFCIINSGSIVEHDSRIGDFVHIAPGAIVCGGVEIGEGTFIGAGAVLIPGVKVGEDCIIGAGSVVISSLSDGLCVAGNPARPIK